MDPRISRRTLLAGTAGAVLLAACGGGSDGDSEGAATATTTPEPDQLELLVAIPQVVSGSEQRVTLAVLRNATPIADPGLQLAFGRRFGAVGEPKPARVHKDGIEDRPYYSTTFTFDQPGTWVIEGSLGGKKGGGVLEVIAPGSTKVPLPGQKMIPVATPIPSDHRGVEPICTRQPVCPLHEVSLDNALGEGKPLAVLFATPALCQSRTCGPVLDILLDEVPRFADRVRFVHVEVYKSLDTKFTAEDLAPGMKAYNLPFEPVLYLAGADGVIRSRLGGPFDRTEARESLTALVG